MKHASWAFLELADDSLKHNNRSRLDARIPVLGRMRTTKAQTSLRIHKDKDLFGAFVIGFLKSTISKLLSCVCNVFVRVCLYVLCGHLLGKGWSLGSRLWCLTVSLSIFPLVSWVRRGTWLYRFLIFARLLTLLRAKTNLLATRCSSGE